MKVEEGEDYTSLSIFDEGKVDPEMILIIQRAGGGKSLCAESIIEEYHKAGYVIISLTDVKEEFELCYAMFEPQESFHLKKLQYEGKKPSKKKVKIYHPFTFNIPKTNLPEINWFTIPLKSLSMPHIKFIAETNYETDSVKLLVNALGSLSSNQNLYDLIHYIRKHSKVTKKKEWGKDIAEPDKDLFYLDVSQKGTITDVSEIASWFKPFVKNYMLAPSNFKLSLDVKKILDDQESYHCLSTKWIPAINDKLKYFTILSFFYEIMSQKDYAKHPILFVIEEVSYLMPFRSEGYPAYLSAYIRSQLITQRSKGRGCASIMTSQTLFDIDEQIREKATQMLLGNLKGVSDLDRVVKSLKYKGDLPELLRTLKRNNYIFVGDEDMEAFRVLFPSHCHAETKYRFIEMYQRFYPDKMTKYAVLIDEVKQHLKEIQKDFDAKTSKEKKEKQKEAEEDYKKKAGLDKAEKEVEAMKDKYKGLKESTRDEKIAKCLELREKEPDMGIRKIAEIIGVSKSAAAGYLKIANERKKLPKVKDKGDGINYEEMSQK